VTKILKNLAFILMSWRRRLKFLKIIYSSGGGGAGALDYQRRRRRLKNLGNFSSVGGGG
jgi:hypothetical protein